MKPFFWWVLALVRAHRQDPWTGGGSLPTPFLVSWTHEALRAAKLSPNGGDRQLLQASYGPDGPWLAVSVGVGNFSGQGAADAAAFGPVRVPLYPCGAATSQAIGKQMGGYYSYRDSCGAVKAWDSAANPEDWFAVTMHHGSSLGMIAYDQVQLLESPSSDLGSGRSVRANTSVFEAHEWNITLPNSQSYNNTVGVLGIGRTGDTSMAEPVVSGILDQFKKEGEIPSNSFGLHIGSAALNLSGSLALGGYDVERVLGPVGNFWYSAGTPLAVLKDINFGVLAGGSPFSSEHLEHLYLGNNGSEAAERLRKIYGAPYGSTMVVPNPATPYISLPPGNCENIANQLPVTWRADIGYYIWNKDDPEFPRIVNSPAYMEFILGDQQQKDLSVKVPFKLLNLTLESPIVDRPTPYFPCRPLKNPYGIYALGRAFLQGAFLGVHYEHNITWIGQAPGPDVLPPQLLPIQETDRTLRTRPLDRFGLSWGAKLTPLPENPPSKGLDGFQSALDLR